MSKRAPRRATHPSSLELRLLGPFSRQSGLTLIRLLPQALSGVAVEAQLPASLRKNSFRPGGNAAVFGDGKEVADRISLSGRP